MQQSQYIRMIFDESCNTKEYRAMADENSALLSQE